MMDSFWMYTHTGGAAGGVQSVVCFHVGYVTKLIKLTIYELNKEVTFEAGSYGN